MKILLFSCARRQNFVLQGRRKRSVSVLEEQHSQAQMLSGAASLSKLTCFSKITPTEECKKVNAVLTVCKQALHAEGLYDSSAQAAVAL